MGIVYNTSVVKDGLVLHLDAANPKSFSNNVHPYALDIWKWYNSNAANNATASRDITTKSPLGGIPLKMTVTGLDPYINSYNASKWNLAPALSGQTWTVSCYVKSDIPTYVQICTMEAGATGNYLTSSNSYVQIPANMWVRISCSRTLNDASTAYVQCRLDGPDTGFGTDGVTRPNLWWDGLQVERNSSATPFNPICNTNGTSWQDLSGKKYSATLVGFPTYSNGALQFRTSAIQYATLQFDEGVLRQQNQTGQWSLETWFKYVSAPNSDESFIVGRAGCHGGIYLYGNAKLYNAIKTTQCWTGAINLQVKTLAPNENIHSVMTYNNGVMKSYINGVYVGTASLDLVNYPHLAYGTELLIGGSNYTMYRTNTDIYKISSYNRELKAVEVKQNFEALRGRYGI